MSARKERAAFERGKKDAAQGRAPVVRREGGNVVVEFSADALVHDWTRSMRVAYLAGYAEESAPASVPAKKRFFDFEYGREPYACPLQVEAETREEAEEKVRERISGQVEFRAERLRFVGESSERCPTEADIVWGQQAGGGRRGGR